MKKIAAIVLGLALVGAACGDSSDETTVPEPTEGTVADTAPAETSPTTLALLESSDMDCAVIWPEDFVQSVLGDQFALGGTTGDGSGCSFEALPSTMVLSWRPGSQADFDAAKEGASLTSDITDVPVCAGGWFIDLGAVVILEALGDGKIFNATSSGVDDAVTAATALLASAC